MRSAFIVILFILQTFSSVAQDEIEYRLDDFFNKTTRNNYSYRQVIKKEDSVWTSSIYERNGKLVSLAHYNDEKLRILTGYHVMYEKGKKFYEGYYKNNRPAGIWYFYEPYGVLSDSLNYDYYKNRFPAKGPNNRLDSSIVQKYSVQVPDTLANQKRDTSGTFTRVDIESEFPGGIPAWKRYLQRNLIPKDGFPNYVYRNSGTVIVQFVVCTDGGICNVEPTTSVHPLADWAAVKTIRKGPYWKPAEQNNRKVKAFHIQPITFVFDME